MRGEGKRTLVRVMTNYARLFLGVLGGLALVPIVAWAIGREAAGLVLMLGSSAGLASMANELVHASLVRELGSVYHASEKRRLSGDTSTPDPLPAAFNAALVLSRWLGLAGLGLFTLLIGAMPWLKIPDDLRAAAVWFGIAKAFEATCKVMLAPALNVLLVRERMAWYNGWQLAVQLCPPAAAVIMFLLLGVRDPAFGLAAYGWLSAGMAVAMVASVGAYSMLSDPRLRPRWGAATREARRPMLAVGGMNALTVLAMNLHLRVNHIITNVFFGATGNFVYGSAMTLTSYTRRLTQGVTDGLDAVATRVSGNAGDDPEAQRQRLAGLLKQSTLMHALVALPSGLVVVVLAEPIVRVWLAGREAAGDDPQPETWPVSTAAMIAALTLGMTARAISDGWMRILYGAGFIKRYAWVIFASGLLNPVLAVMLVLSLRGDATADAATLVHPPLGFYGPAISFSLLMTVFHLGWLGRIAGQSLGMPLRAVYGPILRPLIATLIPAPLLVGAAWLFDHWTLVHLGVVVAAYGVAWLAVTWVIAMPPQLKQRLLRRGRGSAGANAPATTPADRAGKRAGDRAGDVPAISE